MPLSSLDTDERAIRAPLSKSETVVSDRDDDLERALRRVLGPSVLRRSRVCLPWWCLCLNGALLAWQNVYRGPNRN